MSTHAASQHTSFPSSNTPTSPELASFAHLFDQSIPGLRIDLSYTPINAAPGIIRDLVDTTDPAFQLPDVHCLEPCSSSEGRRHQRQEIEHESEYPNFLEAKISSLQSSDAPDFYFNHFDSSWASSLESPPPKGHELSKVNSLFNTSPSSGFSVVDPRRLELNASLPTPITITNAPNDRFVLRTPSSTPSSARQTSKTEATPKIRQAIRLPSKLSKSTLPQPKSPPTNPRYYINTTNNFPPYPSTHAQRTASRLLYHTSNLRRNAWPLYQIDSAIDHMLAIRDAGYISGEDRFRDTSARLLLHNNITRSWFAVKNMWNRIGRERSGFDERRAKTDALRTSIQRRKEKRRRRKEEDGDDYDDGGETGGRQCDSEGSK